MKTIMKAENRITPKAIYSNRSIQIRKLKGAWTGKCRSVVSWYNREIYIQLVIKEQGFVEGKVGDATLVNGRLTDNHNILTHLLHLTVSDYRIDADLIGAIVEKEKIIRKKITILFKVKGNQLTGGFTTSGTKFGDKSSMKMSAYKMKLIRRRGLYSPRIAGFELGN